MTIAEMVHIRNEISHAAGMLYWFKSEGYIYGSKKITEQLIQEWTNKLEFWKNELLV